MRGILFLLACAASAVAGLAADAVAQTATGSMPGACGSASSAAVTGAYRAVC